MCILEIKPKQIKQDLSCYLYLQNGPLPSNWAVQNSQTEQIWSRWLSKHLCINMENIKWKFTEKSWKHCGKRRNFLFWEISPFVKMFSTVFCSVASEIGCMWGRVESFHLADAFDASAADKHCDTFSFSNNIVLKSKVNCFQTHLDVGKG